MLMRSRVNIQAGKAGLVPWPRSLTHWLGGSGQLVVAKNKHSFGCTYQ
jgi:hypothetical protein